MPLFCCGKKSTPQEPVSKQIASKEHVVKIPTVEIDEPMDVKFSDLRDLFDLFDHNKDGQISKDEIMVNLTALRLPITYDDVTAMMKIYDTDKDGSLNFLEFTRLIKHYMETKDFPLDDMFQFFDEDGDNYIDHNEFVKAMRCLGVDMSTEKAREILPEYYIPGTENIDYDNFVKLMKTYLS